MDSPRDVGPYSGYLAKLLDGRGSNASEAAEVDEQSAAPGCSDPGDRIERRANPLLAP